MLRTILWISLLPCLIRQSLATEQTLKERIGRRSFPSVFQAWNPADNLKESRETTEARHDLIFHGESFFGLEWVNTHPGLSTTFTADSIKRALERRVSLLQKNPTLLLLIEIRYRDAHRSFLPHGHHWWKRDDKGEIVPGWEEGGYLQLDFANPEYREQVAKQAHAVISSGVADGIMLDWWQDDADRLALAQTIRSKIGEEALIMVNANDRSTPRTAPFINGYFMECYRSQSKDDWKRIADTLSWAESNLRQPRINCLETWWHKSRADHALMRATTTLSLALSDGYCLFSDPNTLPSPDHLHDWYPFWDTKIGRPTAKGTSRPDGAMAREFTSATVIHNPIGNPVVTVSFEGLRTSVATGKRSQIHTVPPFDGDIFIKDETAKQ